ncbi:discoidin domain-containing protein [Allochromatium vinosum]|uniref:Coagulation factor 5/8 type domain protein n=1 Tax=Allochromatium vinosum (strain ATCC 17899 / DSM 180 / NBRC 103801 / NCIMB 10441 / D) TaxID=572477 RepID=D3RRV9_ALLVD|nr:discoidin domain-containing protein [Allochromatium vinosum]ADC62013.1 coagulation factor 5/8 type domain protein [Allochromatium vinosum DSM 180]MBK1655721.1 hypothetical protein [Allochromatium vinosum]
MSLPDKRLWTATASGGDPRTAIDGSYSTHWVAETVTPPWLVIDLGRIATLGGLEIYWGRQSAQRFSCAASLDGQYWEPLCATRHGEGGCNVFAFPPQEARFVRWSTAEPSSPAIEIVQINLYAPDEAASVLEPGRLTVLGQGGPVRLAPGDSLTVDFGYIRSPLGVLVQWGQDHGTLFSVHLSDDGQSFREVGRILQSHGDTDSFYWRVTTSRYLRFTLHEASRPQGAIVEELMLRILNKDRMPIGRLERAAQAGNGELYPQSLLGRQVYWTALGDVDQDEQALFDEYGNLEPRPGSGQLAPLLRLDGCLHGAPGATGIRHELAEGALPIPSVTWPAGVVELRMTALVQAAVAHVEYRLTNRGESRQSGTLILAVRPVQINPYWQHGGHAAIRSIALDGRRVRVNGAPYAVFSRQPDAFTVADFDDGDVVRSIENGPVRTATRLDSDSGLLSGAFEFDFSLEPGAEVTLVAAAPMCEGLEPTTEADFPSRRRAVVQRWRERLGSRRIQVGDPEVSDTVEAQTALILVNATRFAFKPGPRNYDRTWIRDGSSQALALLYAGLAEEAKRYVLWYAERLYPNGQVPPILDPDGRVNRGYGSDIEFDAQGQFVRIAADVYRLTRDRAFLEAVFEPVVRATRFIEELRARTNAVHGPESRFHGLLAPSISHEGYNKPTYSYWDDFFALSAWRDCAYLAAELGAADIAAEAERQAREFTASLTRSLRLSAEAMGSGLLPASADRLDVDPTSTAIAFEPCRVEDVLPAEYIGPTYDDYRRHLDIIRAPDFSGGFTPYEIRNLNVFVALGRTEDACRLLADALGWRRPAGWRHWAEVVWGDPRAADYIGDMPHTWIGAEFATAVRRMLLRENGTTLELLRTVPERWWDGEGIRLAGVPSAFGTVDLQARRTATQVSIELALSGPDPEQILVHCPGVRRAHADGIACECDGVFIRTGRFARLVIEL